MVKFWGEMLPLLRPQPTGAENGSDPEAKIQSILVAGILPVIWKLMGENEGFINYYWSLQNAASPVWGCKEMDQDSF